MLIKNRRNEIVFGFTIIASILLIPLIINISTSSFNSDNSLSPSLASGDNFDILEFWDNEIERVNNTPINIVYGDNRTILQ